MSDKATILQDHYSTFQKGYLYARANEEVSVICINGNVAIVELKGKRFPIRVEDLKLKT